MNQANPGAGNRSVLLIPSVRQGNGTGHLKRCVETAQALGREEDVDVSLFLADTKPVLAAVDAILGSFPDVKVVADRDGAFDTTVLDQRETPRAFVDELRKSSMVVGLDEGGEGRGYCDYLIDTFPILDGVSAPNSNIQASRSPKHKRSGSVKAHNTILVTFGGEDPAALTPLVCNALVNGGFDPAKITAVRGPSAPVWRLPGGVQLFEQVSNLREILYRFDLVVTSYGLTAFEVLSAGSSLVLVNPTAYHTELSDKAGFLCVGTGSVDGGALIDLVNSPVELAARSADVRSRLEETGWQADADGIELLAGAIRALSPDGLSRCPACGADSAGVVARFPGHSFLSCPGSGLVYQRDFTGRTPDYNEEYFFTDYQAQYGRTYLEDFAFIAELAVPRLKHIKKHLPKRGRNTLLDIGCAYGPFLDAAKKHGFSCCGTDIAQTAVDHVVETLGMQAVRAEFPALDPIAEFGIGKFSAVTMWYVIEHFKDLRSVLDKVSALVEEGGVFAFSTPNINGISGRKNSVRFLGDSPSDHYTVWSPRIAKRVLRRFGFRVVRIRVTGHHPERFSRNKSSKPVRSMVGLYSRIRRLGDTFEVYAVRTGEEAG